MHAVAVAILLRCCGGGRRRVGSGSRRRATARAGHRGGAAALIVLGSLGRSTLARPGGQVAPEVAVTLLASAALAVTGVAVLTVTARTRRVRRAVDDLVARLARRSSAAWEGGAGSSAPSASRCPTTGWVDDAGPRHRRRGPVVESAPGGDRGARRLRSSGFSWRPGTRRPTCWRSSRPPPGCRCGTPSSPPSPTPGWPRCRPRAAAWSPPPTPNAGASNATCTTAPSSAW